MTKAYRLAALLVAALAASPVVAQTSSSEDPAQQLKALVSAANQDVQKALPFLLVPEPTDGPPEESEYFIDMKTRIELYPCGGERCLRVVFLDKTVAEKKYLELYREKGAEAAAAAQGSYVTQLSAPLSALDLASAVPISQAIRPDPGRTFDQGASLYGYTIGCRQNGCIDERFVDFSEIKGLPSFDQLAGDPVQSDEIMLLVSTEESGAAAILETIRSAAPP